MTVIKNASGWVVLAKLKMFLQMPGGTSWDTASLPSSLASRWCTFFVSQSYVMVGLVLILLSSPSPVVGFGGAVEPSLWLVAFLLL